jgi:hypothetical protein
MLEQFVVFYVAALVSNVAFVGASATVASALGVHILEMQTGIGRILRIGKLNIGAIPINGSVRMASVFEHKDQFDDALYFEHQPRVARAAIALAGAVGMLLIALGVRGAAGWQSFLNAFEQIISGALAPNTRGVELIAGYLRVGASEGPLVAIGVLLAKIAAFNLLPLPWMAGGATLIHLLWPSRHGPSESAWHWMAKAGLVLILALMLPWLWAIYTVLALNPAAPAT